MMKTPRIYLDTSVIGGCFDEGFKPWSLALFNDVKKGTYKAVTSEIVAGEIADAPEQVQEKYRELLAMGVEKLTETEESESLLQEYKQREILTPKFIDDMNHIALATVAEVDVMVSWNFKHIVNLGKIRLFNAANMACGYKHLEIYSPMEVSSYEKDI